jgi:hypothetical protein
MTEYQRNASHLSVGDPNGLAKKLLRIYHNRFAHITNSSITHFTMADGVLQLVCECKVRHLKTGLPRRKLKIQS